MNKRFLEFAPTGFLCPYCGKRHDCDNSWELQLFDSTKNPLKLKCCNGIKANRLIQYYFDESGIHVSTTPICLRGYLSLNETIQFSRIYESGKSEPYIFFDVPFVSKEPIGWKECSDCDSYGQCLIKKLADENNSQFVKIKMGFEFSWIDYEKFSNMVKLKLR